MATTTPAQLPSTRARPPRRLWAFRAFAVLAGLAFFALIEGALALFGFGSHADHRDPFVGFTSIYPLFQLDADGKTYRIAQSRLTHFAPDEFPAVKPVKGFRIFCFGESTVQGNPFSKETSFTTWLELALRTVDPGRDWDVVNCGGISYASYRLAPILDECLKYDPDLFILCVGHNEFLEERTYARIKQSPGAWNHAVARASQLRTYQLLERLIRGSDHSSTAANEASKYWMKPEADALLDYKNGIAAYHRDDAWQADVIAHYEANIRRMVAMATEAGVPVVLIAPPSNLADCPPFKSQHRDGLSDADLARWNQLVEQGRAKFRDDPDAAIAILKQALAIDDQYAALHYELGACYESLEQWDTARDSYVRARDLDICPLRILSPMEAILKQVASDTGVTFIDAHTLLEGESPHGILGEDWLVDHIHPSIGGHQRLTEAILQQMAEQGWTTLPENWKSQSEPVWQAHFDSLGDMYFLRGKRHLDNLRAWATGRADGPPIEQRIRVRQNADSPATP